MFIILSAAIAPGLALLSYFYMRNQMATEPRRTLIHAFIYGAIVTFPILFIQYVLQEEHAFASVFVTNVVFTSIIEEFFKWLIIFVIILRNVEFDDPYDGILYGAAVSLGFATVENIIYLLSFGLNTAFIRAILPVSSHALFGVVMGYYFGKSKFSNDNKGNEYLLLALGAPIVLHFSYNTIWTLGGNFVYLMVPFMLFLWWFGLSKVKHAHQHLIEHLIQNRKI